VFEALASSFQIRFKVLQVLIQAYDLPLARTGHLWDLLNTEEQAMPVSVAAEGVASTEFARLGIELATMERHDLPGDPARP
jgi:hypothetical protein